MPQSALCTPPPHITALRERMRLMRVLAPLGSARSRSYRVALDGELLDESKTWAEYALEQGTWISLVPRPGAWFQIFCKTLTGTLIAAPYMFLNNKLSCCSCACACVRVR